MSRAPWNSRYPLELSQSHNGDLHGNNSDCGFANLIARRRRLVRPRALVRKTTAVVAVISFALCGTLALFVERIPAWQASQKDKNPIFPRRSLTSNRSRGLRKFHRIRTCQKRKLLLNSFKTLPSPPLALQLLHRRACNQPRRDGSRVRWSFPLRKFGVVISLASSNV